jgi:hypothetical protein
MTDAPMYDLAMLAAFRMDYGIYHVFERAQGAVARCTYLLGAMTMSARGVGSILLQRRYGTEPDSPALYLYSTIYYYISDTNPKVHRDLA